MGVAGVVLALFLWVAPASAADITRPDSGDAGSTDFLADQLSPPDFASAPAFGGGFVSSSARTVLAAGFVFSLIFGLAFFAKKVLLKGVGVGSRGRFIRVADTLFLGPRKSLWVVEAYGQKFLLATVGSGLQFLSKIDDHPDHGVPAKTQDHLAPPREEAAFAVESNWPKPVPVKEFLKGSTTGRPGSWLQRIKKAQMENRKQGM